MDYYKQLAAILGGVHSYENIRQAVNGFPIAASSRPHHFRKRRGNSTGHMVDFILADLAGGGAGRPCSIACFSCCSPMIFGAQPYKITI